MQYAGMGRKCTEQSFLLLQNLALQLKLGQRYQPEGIGGHGTLQKYRGTGTPYFAKISTAVTGTFKLKVPQYFCGTFLKN